jgi:hypothetical protein
MAKLQFNNLTSILKKYKTGWVAISETQKKVVAHAKDFATINKKARKKRDIVLMPASNNYFGFITIIKI